MLSSDEKSTVQALDLTQASLPMVKGRGETRTYDYKRHGTTIVFAALTVLTGYGHQPLQASAPASGMVKCLSTTDRHVRKDLQIHLILTARHPLSEDLRNGLDKTPGSTSTYPDVLVRLNLWNAGSGN